MGSATNPFLEGTFLGVDVAEFGRDATLFARTREGVVKPSGRGEGAAVAGVEVAVLGRDETGVEDALTFAGVFFCGTTDTLGDGAAVKPFFVEATALPTGEILLTGGLPGVTLPVEDFATGLAFGTGVDFAKLFLFEISSVILRLYSSSFIPVSSFKSISSSCSSS